MKRIFGFFLSLCLLVFLITPKQAYAAIVQQSFSPSQNIEITITNTSGALLCVLAGINPLDPNGCAIPTIKDGKVSYDLQKNNPDMSIMGFVSKSIDTTYEMPVSSNDYISYLGNQFNFPHKALADGVGLNSIKPIVNIWIVFRNLCLTIFVLLTVIIGLLIMLRIKIDQRTVMALENQLPKLVITLLLINFSFAIAGFMIDLMHVTDNIVYNVLYQIEPNPAFNPVTVIQKQETPLALINNAQMNPFVISAVLAGSLWGDVRSVLGISDTGIVNLITPAIPIIGPYLPPVTSNTNDTGSNAGSLAINALGSLAYTPGIVLAGIGNIARGASPFDQLFNWIGFALVDPTAAWAGEAASTNGFLGTDCGLVCASAVHSGINVVGTPVLTETLKTVGVFVALIFLVYIAILIAMIKVLFNLITSYVSIIFNIVMSPFLLFMGALPGSQGGFAPWIKGLTADLLVFPATLGVIQLTTIISNVLLNHNFFHPPLVPAIGGAGIAALFQFGGLLTAAYVRDPIRAAFGIKDGKLGGQIIGAAFVGGALLQKSIGTFKGLRAGQTETYYNPGSDTRYVRIKDAAGNDIPDPADPSGTGFRTHVTEGTSAKWDAKKRASNPRDFIGGLF